MAFKLGDFTTGNAFFWQDVDLTIYAGNDSGLTPYSIVLTDAAGKTARGFIGAVGAGGAGPAGESLDANFVTNGDFSSAAGWTPVNFVISGGLCSIINAIGTIRRSTVSSAGWLVLTSFDLVAETAANVRYYFGSLSFSYQSVPATYTKYQTLNADNAEVGANSGANATLTIDNILAQHVLDPPSTGVHIVSAYGGSVRAWASIDSGFDPNTITTAVVYKNCDYTGTIALNLLPSAPLGIVDAVYLANIPMAIAPSYSSILDAVYQGNIPLAVLPGYVAILEAVYAGDIPIVLTPAYISALEMIYTGDIPLAISPSTLKAFLEKSYDGNIPIVFAPSYSSAVEAIYAGNIALVLLPGHQLVLIIPIDRVWRTSKIETECVLMSKIETERILISRLNEN